MVATVLDSYATVALVGNTSAPMMLKVWPKGSLVRLPALSLKWRPVLVRLEPKSFSWPKLTASVKEVPAATLASCLSPKVTLSLEITMSLVPVLLMVMPSPLNVTVLPPTPLAVTVFAVIVSNTGRSANWICMLPLPSVTVCTFLAL